MKTKLELNQWYKIQYLKETSKRGYWGPAKYKGSHCGLEAFLIPEDLHTEGDRLDETYSFFSPKDVKGEWIGTAPLGFYDLQKRVKYLEKLVDELENRIVESSNEF